MVVELIDVVLGIGAMGGLLLTPTGASSGHAWYRTPNSGGWEVRFPGGFLLLGGGFVFEEKNLRPTYATNPVCLLANFEHWLRDCTNVKTHMSDCYVYAFESFQCFQMKGLF